MTFTIVFFGWIFSLCLHEFSHALVAYLGGDYTVREKGYLSFNPLKYTHPLFSIVLPLLFLMMGGIGLPGGAVYIERWRIRNRFMLSLMSLAGPLSNLLVAIVLGLILRFSPSIPTTYLPGLSFLLMLQVSAVLFNSIPLPPFDGYHVLEPFLPSVIRAQMDRFANVAIWVVLLLFWFVPAVSRSFLETVAVVSTFLGVDWGWVIAGFERFRFWEL
jgi:Zn-dependent protease